VPRPTRSAALNVYRRFALLCTLLMAALMFLPAVDAEAAPARPKVVSPKSATTTPAKKPAAKEPTAPALGAAKSGSAPAAKPNSKPKVDTGRRETEIYGDRLDGLQHEVDDLKDRIFRSKARLSLLKETVLHGVLAGSRIIIAHRNVMSSQFRLVKVAVILDGAQIYARNDTSEQGGSLNQEDELIVFDGNLVPGPHSVTVELTYRGHGFGMFSYLNNYTFDSRSSHSFIAPENGALRVLSVGFEGGNLTTEMKDRPSIDWQEIPLDASGKPLPKAAGRKKKGGRSKTSKTVKSKNSASVDTGGSAKKGGSTASPKAAAPAKGQPTPKPKASNK
jgi:hypothetical protein